MFWLLIAEIYPLKIRGAGMSVATTANWTANFVVTISFLTLLNAVSGSAHSSCSRSSPWPLASFWRKAPETKGRSLQEIERDLAVEPEPAGLVPASNR